MSKKTLYAQFPSKTELLQAVLLAKFRSIETDLDAIMAVSAKDASAALHQLLACMQRHTEEIRPPFVRDMRRETPELFQLVEERRRDLIQRYFGRIFDQGRRAGVTPRRHLQRIDRGNSPRSSAGGHESGKNRTPGTRAETRCTGGNCFGNSRRRNDREGEV